MSCSTKYTKIKNNSLQSVKNQLLAIKAIDKYNNVLDYTKFINAIGDINRNARLKHGFNTNIVLASDIAGNKGKKAYFDKNLFDIIDRNENVYYQKIEEEQVVKPDVILPIGTSGSGKSTFIKSLPQENLVVIEPDAMRVEFTGNMNDKSKDKEIYIEAANRAIQAIKQGKQVVFDTTNLTKDKRLPFIEAIKKAIPNANIQYKLMELNPELAKQRIKAQLERGENRANVSDATIDRHAESYKQMLEDIKNEPITEYKSNYVQNIKQNKDLSIESETLQNNTQDLSQELNDTTDLNLTCFL